MDTWDRQTTWPHVLLQLPCGHIITGGIVRTGTGQGGKGVIGWGECERVRLHGHANKNSPLLLVWQKFSWKIKESHSNKWHFIRSDSADCSLERERSLITAKDETQNNLMSMICLKANFQRIQIMSSHSQTKRAAHDLCVVATLWWGRGTELPDTVLASITLEKSNLISSVKRSSQTANKTMQNLI